MCIYSCRYAVVRDLAGQSTVIAFDPGRKIGATGALSPAHILYVSGSLAAVLALTTPVDVRAPVGMLLKWS